MTLDGIFLRKNSQSFSSVAFMILALNRKNPHLITRMNKVIMKLKNS